MRSTSRETLGWLTSMSEVTSRSRAVMSGARVTVSSTSYSAWERVVSSKSALMSPNTSC